MVRFHFNAPFTKRTQKNFRLYMLIGRADDTGRGKRKERVKMDEKLSEAKRRLHL